MLIDQINLNLLRVFVAVFEEKSMTGAAKRLHLTQSGVSQHIRSVEEILQKKLFDRVHQKLLPTDSGKTLYAACDASLKNLARVLDTIHARPLTLGGTVSIGMPVEFGVNVIVPFLGEFALKNPAIQFKLMLDFASVMNAELLSGKLDFAFVDTFRMNYRIETKKVYDETLELCILRNPKNRPSSIRESRSFFESLDYIDYQEGEPILRMWFHHHFGKKPMNLKIRANVMDVQAVSRLIIGGVGAGVLPYHQIAKLAKEGHVLHRFRGCGKPMKNVISLAQVKGREVTAPCQSALSWLLSGIASTTKSIPMNQI